MRSNPQRFLFSLALLLLALILTSCDVGPQSVDASTPPPISSPVPTETATPTVEPTKSPDQIAEDLEGLNLERDYVVRGDHLVDAYNDAPKAARAEDGSWRELDYNDPEDAEAMYGHLVPEGLPYIDTSDSPSSYYGKMFGLQMVYLGDVSWEKEEFNGRTVDMAYLLAGIRDGGGSLHVAKFGVDAMNTGTPHFFEYNLRNPDDSLWGDGWKRGGSTIELAIKESLNPGDIFREFLINPLIMVEVSTGEAGYGPPENVDEFKMITDTLFNQNKAEMMTKDEWKLMEEGAWPDRAVNIYPHGGIATMLSAPILDW